MDFLEWTQDLVLLKCNKIIQQPEPGRKIADYRKSKGLIQEELVGKCNFL